MPFTTTSYEYSTKSPDFGDELSNLLSQIEKFLSDPVNMGLTIGGGVLLCSMLIICCRCKCQQAARRRETRKFIDAAFQKDYTPLLESGISSESMTRLKSQSGSIPSVSIASTTFHHNDKMDAANPDIEMIDYKPTYP